jgi:hypothetical protein
MRTLKRKDIVEIKINDIDNITLDIENKCGNLILFKSTQDISGKCGENLFWNFATGDVAPRLANEIYENFENI